MSSMGRNILIVFAHWNRETSLNGALLDAAIETLTQQGHNAIVSDLYQMNFNPVISPKDAGILIMHFYFKNKNPLLTNFCHFSLHI